MPWYRIPFSMAERSRRAAEELARSKRAQMDQTSRAILDCLRASNAEDRVSDAAAAGEFLHLNFGRAKNRTAPAPCVVCGWISERLCDWIVDPIAHGRTSADLEPDGTCSRPLCWWCTHEPRAGKDLCPEHALAFKTWLAGRTNTTDGDG